MSIAVFDPSESEIPGLPKTTVNKLGTIIPAPAGDRKNLSDGAITLSLDDRPEIVMSPLLTTKRPLTQARFIAAVRWEGSVTELFDTYFRADIINLDTDETANVEFLFTEVSSGDLSLCQLGALFYWSVGFDVKEGGQRSRSSVVSFRRLGKAALEDIP